jgi:tape measure domain-containing protein
MSNSYTMNATSADKVKVSIDTINKAMITGKITGKQWTQLMSSTSNIASALADSMGMAEKDIKQLGVNGQISMRQLADAMIKVKDETGAMADAMGFTGKDGVTILANSFKHLVGEFNKSYGITKSLANGLILVANNIELIGIAGAAFTGIGLSRYFGSLSNSIVKATKTTLANRTAQISQAQEQLMAVKSLQLKAAAEVNAARFEAQRAVGLKASLVAQNNLTAAINRQTQANIALAAAQTKVNTLTSKFNLLSRAGSGLLGLLGGPLGLATTALSVGAAFFAMGDGADKAKKPLEELHLPVDELLAKFKELDKGKQQSITSKLKLKADADSKQVDDEIDKLQKQLEEKLKTSWETNGNYSIHRAVSKEDQSAIYSYIDQLKELKKSYDEGAISKHDFGNKVGELNEKFADAVGKGQEFKTVLGSMTSAVHSSIDALAESKEKIEAVGKASVETAEEIKTLDVKDFPNLKNQLGVLSQQLQVANTKSEYGAEAAFVLAG